MRCNELFITLTYAEFQSTHPVWDGTVGADSWFTVRKISIHPSRVGWDANLQLVTRHHMQFQSTHPVWDGTLRRRIRLNLYRHFNPPIPCGMGRVPHFAVTYSQQISIHPSRVGWDLMSSRRPSSVLYFNPPIPYGMGLSKHGQEVRLSPFQSTHPVWDGTAALRCRRRAGC